LSIRDRTAASETSTTFSNGAIVRCETA